ncbi:hypothetical protein F5B21DRAFT_227317 [Xylaria acuta]|nr:hypothetical protein F5B21DRAFT_227317 [Xylaria acuta]
MWACSTFAIACGGGILQPPNPSKQARRGLPTLCAPLPCECACAVGEGGAHEPRAAVATTYGFTLDRAELLREMALTLAQHSHDRSLCDVMLRHLDYCTCPTPATRTTRSCATEIGHGLRGGRGPGEGSAVRDRQYLNSTSTIDIGKRSRDPVNGALVPILCVIPWCA